VENDCYIFQSYIHIFIKSNLATGTEFIQHCCIFSVFTKKSRSIVQFWAVLFSAFEILYKLNAKFPASKMSMLY